MAEQIPMGIGQLGFKNLVFKRKFRFTFELSEICGQRTVPKHFVKLAARPSLTVEETEINFLNAKTWIPGKASWETITVTYIDVASNEMQNLYSWLASVYDFTDPIQLSMGSQRQDYSAVATIKMWDGCGQLIDTWILRDVWPTAINFGELAYDNSENAEIELTLRYSDVKYESTCPGFTIDPCCTPCSA